VECMQPVSIARCGIKKSNHRHCCLLCARRKWPGGRRAAPRTGGVYDTGAKVQPLSSRAVG
jgi:hypothetical protein